MKKLFTIIYSFLISLGSMAQIALDGSLNFGSTSSLALSIPKEFCYNDAPMLQMYDNNGGAQRSLLIYDENLNLKETLKINGDRTFDYQITYQDEVRDIESVTLNQEYEECLNQSYDNFIIREKTLDPTFDESKMTITEESNGDKLIILDLTNYVNYLGGSIENYYFGYDIFGTKYPKIYFRCKSDVMYRYRATYKATSQKKQAL